MRHDPVTSRRVCGDKGGAEVVFNIPVFARGVCCLSRDDEVGQVEGCKARPQLPRAVRKGGWKAPVLTRLSEASACFLRKFQPGDS